MNSIRHKRIKTGKVFALIPIILLILLSGCSRKEKEEGKISVTLSFFDRYEKWKGVTDDFMRKNPDIEIKLFQFPGSYIEKISSMFAAGVPPDVIFTGDTKAADFAARGLLFDLTTYIERDKEEIEPSDFYPQLLEKCKYKGRYYGLPVNAGADVIFYNKNLFDKAGLKYPDENLTYEELVEIAKKLTKDTDGDGRTDQYGLFVNWWWYQVLGHVLEWGGDIFNSDLTRCLLDRPENIEAIKYYSDLIKKYRVSPSPIELETQDTMQLFVGGKIAMVVAHYCLCQYFKHIKDFTWDIAPMPKRKGEPRFSYGGMNWLVISEKTKYPEESWKVVKYITGKEGQEYFFKGGFDIPVRKSMGNLILTLTDYPEHRKTFVDSLSYSRLIPTFPSGDEVGEIIRQELDNIFYKDLPVEEGCKRMTKRVNGILSHQED